MDTKFGWRNATKAMMTIAGLAFIAYSTAGDYFDFPSLGEWRTYGVLFASLLFLSGILWHFMDLQFALGDMTPNIEICGDINLHDVTMGNYKSTKEKVIFIPTAISHMANVPFSNRPKHPTDKNNAEKVRAEIAYLDENRKPLFPPIQGRWGNTYQPSEIHRGQSSLIESTDFPNTGAIRWLDLLIKYPEDEYCYAYNNDSYNAPALFLLPAFCIMKNRFFIQVRLIGAYVPNKLWEFEVITKGKGDTFMIRHGKTWKKAANSDAIKVIANTRKKRSSTKKAS